LTQAEAAKLLGLKAASTIAHMERGVSTLQGGRLVLYCQILSERLGRTVTPGYLLDLEEAGVG